MVLAVVLAVPAGGCLDAFLAYAGLEPSPASFQVLYADQTRFDAQDATNETPSRPDVEPTWRQETHVFRAPDGTSNLSVHVDADLAVPPPGDVQRVQAVDVELVGPRGEHREARFTVTGERDWRFPGDASGRWTVTVEARGWGDVWIMAGVQEAPPGSEG